MKEDFCILLSSRHTLFKQKYHRCPQGFRWYLMSKLWTSKLRCKPHLGEVVNQTDEHLQGKPRNIPTKTHSKIIQELLVGWVLTILKNDGVRQWEGLFHIYIYNNYIMENKTWLKPPTSYLRIETNKHEAYHIASNGPMTHLNLWHRLVELLTSPKNIQSYCIYP